jgi:plastocyanin
LRRRRQRLLRHVGCHDRDDRHDHDRRGDDRRKRRWNQRDLAFVQKSLTAKPGRNKIEFTNESPLPHDVKIEENGKEIGGTEVVNNGNAEATVQLDAGEPYTFFCSVPGHRQAGMEGKLTVK